MLDKLSFKGKLIIMLLLPLIGLLYFALSRVANKYSESKEMISINNAAELSVRITSLIHQTQRERGLSVGFLSSHGNDFSSDLKLQYEKTNNAAEELNLYLKDFNKADFTADFNKYLEVALSNLSSIRLKRSNVQSQNVSPDEIIAYYSAINANFIDVIGCVAKISNNAEMASMTSAYVNFLLKKERAGKERAIMNAVFSVDSFNTGMYHKFINIVAEQVTYTNVFLMYANKDQIEFYNNLMQASDIKEVDRMRDIANKNYKTGKFGIDPKYWYKTITGKINHLKIVEDRLSQDLIRKATGLKASAENALWLAITITFLLFSATILLGILIARNIIRQLGGEPAVVIDIAGKIAKGDLTMEFDKNIEYRGLYGEMVKMSLKLKEIMSHIVSSAGNIASASMQMSSSAQQLSHGATEQASSVEQVSASMAQMSESIHRNADNSVQTEKISRKAAKDINESNEAVEKTVSSMRAIASKVSIMGEISRQTNLLALNAAVEAARAGEYGRGFAVVASEVRKLAERSQKAAIEIDEVSKVSVDVAQKSTVLLNEVVPNIQMTAELVQKVAASSVDQNSGAEQIRNAIEQLNQIVQENAASAEELAAGAEELNSQADALEDVVSYFKLQNSPQGGTEKREKEFRRKISVVRN